MVPEDDSSKKPDRSIPTKVTEVDIEVEVKEVEGKKSLLFSVTPRRILSFQPGTSRVTRVNIDDMAPPVLFRPYRRLFIDGKEIGRIQYLFFKSGPYIAVLGALRVKKQPKGSPAPDVIFFPAWGGEPVSLSRKGKTISTIAHVDHISVNIREGKVQFHLSSPVDREGKKAKGFDASSVAETEHGDLLLGSFGVNGIGFLDPPNPVLLKKEDVTEDEVDRIKDVLPGTFFEKHPVIELYEGEELPEGYHLSMDVVISKRKMRTIKREHFPQFVEEEMKKSGEPIKQRLVELTYGDLYIILNFKMVPGLLSTPIQWGSMPIR